jgi:tricorn protease
VARGGDGPAAGRDERPAQCDLQARIDPRAEWRQIFEESWRYQRDFFYDPGTHGADWDAVKSGTSR